MSKFTEDDRVVVCATFYLVGFLWYAGLDEAAVVYKQVSRLVKLLGADFHWEVIANKLDWAARNTKNKKTAIAAVQLHAVSRELQHAIADTRNRPTCTFKDAIS